MVRRTQAWLLSLWVASCGSAVTAPGLLAEGMRPDALYDRSYALVIGIEQYMASPPVPGAAEEAKQVAHVFRGLGFEDVTELYNKDATSRRVQEVLTDILTRKVGPMGRVVVFFVGHTGISRDSKGREFGYLVPVDAPVNNVAKSVTVDMLKEITRRSASKHTLLVIDAPIRGWDATSLKTISPDGATAGRAVQVIAAADKGEKSIRVGGRTVFVQAFLTGLSGAADLDHNGWLTASELGTYIKQQVDTVAKGSQHVSHVRIDGNGDTVLVQQHKAVPQPDTAVQLPLKGREAAKAQYEQAVALLQGGKYAEEALARLDRAIEYDPTFGDAYVLKSYLRLEVLPQLDEALAAGEQAVKHAPNNPEAFYTLGLVHEKMEHYRQAEQAFTQAAKLNPNNQEVYFALGKLYADELADDPKSVEAFRRYLELGGSHARARAAVSQAEQEGSPGPGLP